MRFATKQHLKTLAVAFALLAPGAAGAQELADYDYENLAFRGIGVDWGYIWPNKADATPLYSVRADLGFLGPAVRIMPGLHYWSSQLKQAEVDRLAAQLSALPALEDQGVVITGNDLGDIDWSAVSLTIDAQAVWTAPYRVFTFVGLGTSLHLMNGSGASIDGTFIDDLLGTVAPGLAVMAGVEYEPVSSLRLYGEGRYTLQTEVRYPGVRVGAAFMIPNRTGGVQ
jgi:hypothetical protein